MAPLWLLQPSPTLDLTLKRLRCSVGHMKQGFERMGDPILFRGSRGTSAQSWLRQRRAITNFGIRRMKWPRTRKNGHPIVFEGNNKTPSWSGIGWGPKRIAGAERIKSSATCFVEVLNDLQSRCENAYNICVVTAATNPWLVKHFNYCPSQLVGSQVLFSRSRGLVTRSHTPTCLHA